MMPEGSCSHKWRCEERPDLYQRQGAKTVRKDKTNFEIQLWRLMRTLSDFCSASWLDVLALKCPR